MRASAVYRNYDGYIDRYPVANTDILGVGLGAKTANVNTEQTTAANLAVAIKPTDSLVITPSIMYQRIQLGGAFAIDVPPGSFDNPIQTRDADEPSTMQFTLISLPVQPDFGSREPGIVDGLQRWRIFFGRRQFEGELLLPGPCSANLHLSWSLCDRSEDARLHGGAARLCDHRAG